MTTIGTYSIALHGGCGRLSGLGRDKERQNEYLNCLREALGVGTRLLENNQSALDAVTKVVTYLEDCPLFNAGRGSVLNNLGKVEMDAAVMCGRSLQAGAVAAVSRVRNPVLLARRILERCEHVLLVGTGADEYAMEQGFPMEEEAFFVTPLRKKHWQEAQSTAGAVLDHDEKLGTVGAVARDRLGNLAAATSTGGLTNKRTGRVGDTPLIGAGTYADEYCAVSCTGYGEGFIRISAAHSLAARIRWARQTLADASHALLHEELRPIGGEGGLIAVDREGNLTLPFLTAGMFRAWSRENHDEGMAIF